MEEINTPTWFYLLGMGINENGWVELKIKAANRVARMEIEDVFTVDGPELDEDVQLTLVASETNLKMPDYFNRPFPIVSKCILTVLEELGAKIQPYPVQIIEETGNHFGKQDYFAIKILSQFRQLEEADTPLFYLEENSIYINQHIKAAVEKAGITMIKMSDRAICALAESFPGRFVCIAGGRSDSPDFVYPDSPCASDALFTLIKEISNDENLKSRDDFQVKKFTNISFDGRDDSGIPVIFSTSDAAVYAKRELADAAIAAKLDIAFSTSKLFGSRMRTSEQKFDNEDIESTEKPSGGARRMTMDDIIKLKKGKTYRIMNLFIVSKNIRLDKDQLTTVLNVIDDLLGTKEVVTKLIKPNLLLHLIVNEGEDNSVKNCISKAFTSAESSSGKYTISLSDHDPDDIDYENPEYFEETINL